MPAERYYYPGPLVENETIELEGAEVHHLLNVMRAELNDQVELVDGKGALAKGRVQEIKKKLRVDISIYEVSVHPKPSKELILVQALPRANRLDTILEKGTELGMTQLWLFPGQRSERHDIAGTQVERMRLVTVAAMKQCGSYYLPEIVVKPSLAQWKECPPFAMFGDLEPSAPKLIDLREQLREITQYLFFVGPESGFSSQEIELLQNLKVKSVGLHSHVLRTDTASLAALSILSQY